MTRPANNTHPIITRPLAISLFAGVGGLDLGMATGFEIGLAIEADSRTRLQYQVNFPDTDVLCADVTQLSGKEIHNRLEAKYPDWDGTISAIVGGPPCQGFSRMGKRDLSDPRSQLVNHFVRLVGELHPLAFIMENVAGLLDSRYASLVGNVKAQLAEFGYNVQVWELNAADYGVPQSRQRVFFVGNRLGVTISSPPVTEKRTVRDALASLLPIQANLQVDVDTIDIADIEYQSDYIRELHSTFLAPPNWDDRTLTGCALTHHTRSVCDRFASTSPGKTEPISHLQRLAWDGLAPTLRAGTGSDRGSHTAARPIHPEYNRVITVREAARLSSFPDWFQFDQTKWRGFRQVGNAVPPLLARAVAQQVLESIQEPQVICSVDEAGRGCLFGPVVSCAVILDPAKIDFLVAEGVSDSKELSPHNRKRLASLIKDCCLDWRIGIGTVAEIDSINIRNASLNSMSRAVKKLKVFPSIVLVDGNAEIPNLGFPQQCIISGDKSELAIAAASIIAKVWRDDLIERLAKKYPNFGLENHKGYDTPEHREALQKLPPTRQHRKTFSTVRDAVLHQDFQLIEKPSEEKPMSYANDNDTKEIPVTSFEFPSPSSVANKHVNQSSVKVSHTTILGCSDIELLAEATVKSAFSTMRQQISDCITEGQKLIDVKYSLQLHHGEEEGSRRFKSWLKSKDWGSYGGGWAMTLIRLAEFWQKLAPKTQEWVLANLQKLSKGAIKRFANATEIGIDFCLGLVERGKQTGASIDRAIKSRKLKVGDRVTVVDGFRKGYSGQVVEINDSSIMLEFGDGKRESFTPEQLEKQKGFSGGGGGGSSKKSNKDADKDVDKTEQGTNTDTNNSAPLHNFNAGDRIVLIEDDKGWKGAGGTVVAEWEREPGSWWVQLDEVVAQGDVTKHLYKTNQLRLMTLEEIESGVIDMPITPIFSSNELYTKEQVDEMLAQKEKEMMESFIGSKSKLREEVETEVKEEITIGYKLRDKLEAEKRQLLQELESANQMLRSVHPLVDENQQLKTRMADLERALAEKGNNWNQPVFDQEAVKVINKDVAYAAEVLSNKVEELEKICAEQQRTIEELSHNAASISAPAPIQFQETRKLSEKTEQLEMQLKKYQKAEKEAEELDSKLAPIAVGKLGISDWRRGDNGEKYRGLSAILNLIKKLVTSNQQSLEVEEEMAF